MSEEEIRLIRQIVRDEIERYFARRRPKRSPYDASIDRRIKKGNNDKTRGY